MKRKYLMTKFKFGIKLQLNYVFRTMNFFLYFLALSVAQNVSNFLQLLKSGKILYCHLDKNVLFKNLTYI